jgi:2'-5' RNA ligase
MRLFIGIGVPDPAAGALARVQADLRVGRHVDPETFHLTLAFLGDQSVATAEAVHAELLRIDLPEFEMRIRGLDVVGARDPRLVYAGVEKTTELTALREKVRGAARAAEVELPRERFRPHVTLARFKESLPRHKLDKLGAFLEQHGDLSLPPLPVEQFTFFRSHLSQGGATYEVLADYPLRAAEG